MRSVPAAFSAALAADTLVEGVVLIEIGTPTPIYRALWPGNGGGDVVFAGHTYLATRGGFSEIPENLQGERAVWELSLTNVSGPDGTVLPWSLYVQQNDLRGVGVTLSLVLVAQLADATAKIAEDFWKVVRPRVDGEFLRLEIGGPRDALAFQVPYHPIISQSCGWQRMGLYRKHPCNSASDKPTCSGTVAACAERFPGQPLRFGPSFPFYTKSTRRRRA